MATFIRRYMALTIKEVQQLRRNRVLLIQLMLPPTIVLVIFGYALNPKVRDLRLGVVDQSLSTESRGLIDSLAQNVNFKVTHQYLRAQDAEDALKSLKLDLFIVIPPTFARDLGRGQTANVQVVIDAVDANTALRIADFQVGAFRHLQRVICRLLADGKLRGQGMRRDVDLLCTPRRRELVQVHIHLGRAGRKLDANLTCPIRSL